MIEEANRQKSEGKRPRLTPVPDVLVQGIDDDHGERQQNRSHAADGTTGSMKSQPRAGKPGGTHPPYQPHLARFPIYSAIMPVSDSRTSTDLSARAQAAREKVDAQVREIVQWHFDPATGSPFWL